MAARKDKMNPVNWFEIPVKNMKRAKAFYERSFGLKLALSEIEHEWGAFSMAWFPMVGKARGATGALIKGASYKPSHAGTVIYFTVKDMARTLRTIKANGGRTMMPKTGIGEYGSIAQFEDTEGDRLALHSMK